MLGSARDGASGALGSAPPPPAKTSHFLAAPADRACVWPASEWARFRLAHRRQQAPAGIAGPVTVPAPPAGQNRCARAFRIIARQPSFACASTNTSLYNVMCDRTCRYRPAVYVRTYAYIICTHGPPEFGFQLISCLGMCLYLGLPAPRTTRALGACGRAGGSCGKIALKSPPPS